MSLVFTAGAYLEARSSGRDFDLRDVAIVVLVCASGTAVLGGVTYHWILPVSHHQGRMVLDHVFDADPEWVPPAPHADEYPLRLPCSVVLDSLQLLGGVLYLGHRGFLFVPHLHNAPEVRDPIPIGPVRSIVLEVIRFPVPWRLRLRAWRASRDLLLVWWQDGGALFTVPTPAETRRLIYSKLGSWKFDLPAI